MSDLVCVEGDASTPGPPSRVTIIVALHGIGFAKPGSLKPALEQLRGSKTDLLIDANWNDIASLGHDGRLSSNQLSRLCRAIDHTARLRPPMANPGFGISCIETFLDIADFYFTLALWAIGPLALIATLNLFAHLPPMQLPWSVIAQVYLTGYGLLAALGVAALTVGLLLRVPRFTAQAAHLVLLAIRPFWILSYCWMLATRLSSRSGWFFMLVGLEISATVAFVFAGTITNHWLGYALGSAILGLYVLGPLVTATVFAPALKLAEDVLRYVSEPTYRTRIQQSLAEKIELVRPSGKEIDLIIVGHSLGSVIAADLLVNGTFSPEYRELTLVTCGSPIRRLFQGLLPGHLLPGRIERIISTVADKAPFAWYNYYRRFDGVGAKLGLPVSDGFREARSPILRDPLSSHIGYWREPGFFAFVAECRQQRKAP